MRAHLQFRRLCSVFLQGGALPSPSQFALSPRRVLRGTRCIIRAVSRSYFPIRHSYPIQVEHYYYIPWKRLRLVQQPADGAALLK